MPLSSMISKPPVVVVMLERVPASHWSAAWLGVLASRVAAAVAAQRKATKLMKRNMDTEIPLVKPPG
jgi:hypothetical protein